MPPPPPPNGWVLATNADGKMQVKELRMRFKRNEIHPADPNPYV